MIEETTTTLFILGKVLNCISVLRKFHDQLLHFETSKLDCPAISRSVGRGGGGGGGCGGGEGKRKV